MTPGSTAETADGMTLEKIDTIIEDIRYERYRWTPTRRVYIEKKNSTKKRPLSMPTWSDKLVQEVIRLILERYFEPQMSDHSHGFRPKRGCHTALEEIDRTWLGTVWFIEGDVKACFDSIDHTILLQILAEHIHDGRFLRLIRELLQVGYLEDWKYNNTLSGTPQGGIVSPVLSNIYLDKLDKYIENTLQPAYTRGTKREHNPPYTKLLNAAANLRRAGKTEEAMEKRREAQKLPSKDIAASDYRRLKYVRYADDWLIGFIGPKAEAEAIKSSIKLFLQEKLRLQLSEEKTLITHARTEAARFLSYHMTTMHNNTYQTYGKKRNANGKVAMRVPKDILKKKCQKYLENGKPIHRPELTTSTDFSIIALYQAEYRGLVEYYQLANNRYILNELKWVMEQSLTKTLATKLKLSVKQVYRKYQTTLVVDGKPYKGLQVIIPRDGKKPLKATWGGISLKKKTRAILTDQIPTIWGGRTELEKRLLADTCELCGSHERISVHHIRALKDLDQKGRREKPNWAKTMSARRRKTLVVCWSCHMGIQHGHPRKKAENTK
jgi:group II intron reverse transcriptase/maturase